MEIRKATENDGPGIAKVHIGSWQFAYRGQLPDSFLDSLSVEGRTRYWQENLSNLTNPSTTWVAAVNGTIIGFCVVGPSSDDDANPETGTLYAIYIDSNYMGQRVGSKLMAKGLATLKEQGFKEATLWVLDTNTKARRFYESRGWAEDGAKKTEPGDGFDLTETRYRIVLVPMTEPITLIGPMKAGKTTVGKLLAERLACPFISLDRLERDYTIPAGFDENEAAAIHQQQGGLAWYTYRRAFFDEAVVRFLAEHTVGVLELGGGHPIVPDEAKQQRIAEALAPYHQVVLLLPTPDIRESLKILYERQKPEHREPDLNELFLADDRFFRLAKLVIYTEGRTPAEVCEEIVRTFGLAVQ